MLERSGEMRVRVREEEQHTMAVTAGQKQATGPLWWTSSHSGPEPCRHAASQSSQPLLSRCGSAGGIVGPGAGLKRDSQSFGASRPGDNGPAHRASHEQGRPVSRLARDEESGVSLPGGLPCRPSHASCIVPCFHARCDVAVKQCPIHAWAAAVAALRDKVLVGCLVQQQARLSSAMEAGTWQAPRLSAMARCPDSTTEEEAKVKREQQDVF